MADVPAEARRAIEAPLAVLAAHRDRWLAVGVGARIEILDELTRWQ